MPINLRISALVPAALIVESAAEFEDAIVVAASWGRYPGGDMSSVRIAFAARSQPVCS